MYRFCLFILLPAYTVIKGYSQTEEVKKQSPYGISLGASYTTEGLAYVFLLDWSRNNNTFYAGPKVMAERTYVPKKAMYGWDVGYRRQYLSGRLLSCFINLDFQGRVCRTYDLRAQYRWEDRVNPKLNFIGEAFLGNTMLVKLFKDLTLGNTLGAGGCIDSHYSLMRVRKTNFCRSMQVLFFLRYKL